MAYSYRSILTFGAVVVGRTGLGIRHQRAATVEACWAVITVRLAFIRLAGTSRTAHGPARTHLTVMTSPTGVVGGVGCADILQGRAVESSITQPSGVAEARHGAVVASQARGTVRHRTSS